MGFTSFPLPALPLGEERLLFRSQKEFALSVPNPPARLVVNTGRRANCPTFPQPYKRRLKLLWRIKQLMNLGMLPLREVKIVIRILIVEDESKLAKLLKEYLQGEGFQVELAGTLAAAKEKLAFEPELIILDLTLPDGNGLDLLRQIRSTGSELPIIALTARVAELERVLGLELGADDYVTKPFSARELLARIRAILRRTGNLETQETTLVEVGDLSLDLSRHQVRVGPKELSLTPTEFKLLATLAEHPGMLYSRTQLVEIALGDYVPGYERVIDTHMSNLRKKLGDSAQNPKYIATVYSLGYKLLDKGDAK